MRVLHLTARADVGGGPVHVAGLVAGLASRGVDCFIGCPDEGEYVDRFADLIGSDRMITIPASPSRWPASFSTLASRVRRAEIDIVHSHGRGAGLLGRPLGRSAGARTVHTFHGMHFHPQRLRRLAYTRIEATLGALTDWAIAVSPSEAELALANRLVAASRLSVVANGVDVAAISRAAGGRADTGSGSARGLDGRLPVAYIARLESVKGPELAARVAREAELSHPGRFRFVIIGDGPERGSMEEELADLVDAGAVEFRGLVASVDWSEPALVLSTSVREGLPLVLIEALAAGVPVVASDVVGNRDVATVAGEAGRLFDRQDPADAVAQLGWFLDDERRLRSASIARTVAQDHFDRRSMVTAVLAGYQRLLGVDTPERRSGSVVRPAGAPRAATPSSQRPSIG